MMDSVSAREIGESGGSKDGDLRLALKAIEYDGRAYQTIASWWRKRQLPVLPPDSLPRSGIVVTFHGAPIAVGFLYSTDSDLAVFEFATTDPDASPQARSAALDLLLESILDLAKGLEVRGIFTFTSHERWVSKLTKSGWIETERGCSQLIRRVE